MESKIEKQTESCKADTPLHDKIRKGGAIVNRMTSEIGVGHAPLPSAEE